MYLDPMDKQAILIFYYPLIAVIGVAGWALHRINRTELPKSRRWLWRGYVLLLGLLVLPGSIYMFMWFTEPCYGQGSGMYRHMHPLLCENEIARGVPIWGVILYSIDILILLGAILRTTKDFRVSFSGVYLPLLYFTLLRFVALSALAAIENPRPF